MRLQGFFFQICYEYKVRRVNNILIVGQPVILILDKYIQSHKLYLLC